MELDIITNSKSEQLVSFAKLVLSNSISPKFWINKLKSLSYLDIAVLVGFAGLELWGSFSDSFNNNQKLAPSFIEDSLRTIKDFTRELKDEQQPPRTLFVKYFELDESGQIGPIAAIQSIIYGGSISKSFLRALQSEEIFNSLLDALCTIDARLKKKSLQLMPDFVPIYRMNINIGLNLNADDLMALTGLRWLVSTLVHQIGVVYDNVSISSIDKIVAFSTNPNQTYGLRKWASVILLNLSSRQSNIHNIVKAKAYTILKYYDHVEAASRVFDQEAALNILSSIGFSTLPPQVTSNLSESEYQILKSDITNYRFKFIVHKLITSALTFSSSYGLSKNLLASATTLIPSIANGITFKPKYKIANILQMIGFALFVPYWKSTMAILLLTGSSPAEFSAITRALSRPSHKPYTDKQYDQMFPSVDAVLNNGKRG